VLLILHPSLLLCESLSEALGNGDATEIRHTQSLQGALHELRSRSAMLTLAGLEEGAEDVGAYVRKLLENGSESVVVLAPTVEEPDMLAALDAGALGYVGRDQPLDRLVFDVRGALRGEACLPRDKLAPVLRLLIDRNRVEEERAERLGRLSKREREVLDLLAAGDNNDDIATKLFLSRATVRTHVQNILGKLEVHSRMEAVAVAHGSGATRTVGGADVNQA
jgi:DNA-binding NarL/FixJ family response regulator